MRVKLDTLTTLPPSDCQYQIGNCQKPPTLDSGMDIREKVGCEVTRYKGGMCLLSLNWRERYTHCRDHFHLNSKGHFFLLLSVSDASSQGRQIIGCETAQTRLIYDLRIWHVALVLPVSCRNCLS